MFPTRLGRYEILAELAVAESSGPLLDEAVLEAVSDWRFAPASRDGHPVRFRYRMRQSFRLEP